MAFQQGLSGLNATSKNLSVIGNNIANANTYGNKSSRAEFADIYANAVNGSGSNGIGLGVNVTGVEQQFSQGNITTTSNSLDLAINGNGFFQLANDGTTIYSRNGQFQKDKDGFIVNSTGNKLLGYTAGVDGTIIPSSVQALKLPTGSIAPAATTKVALEMNLDSRQKITGPGVTVPIDFVDAKTYNNATSITVFDEKGQEIALTYYFQKTADNTWDVYATANGVPVNGTPAAPTPLITGMAFAPNGGTLTNPVAPVTMDVPAVALLTGGLTLPITGLQIDLSGATQYGSKFAVTNLSQDGYAPGDLTGVVIDKLGIVNAQYSNGLSKPAGQVVLASFNNPQGLQPLGGNVWASTHESGDPVIGPAGQGSIGTMQSGALEESNVDLTAELVNMIVAQRAYQANAQTIKTEDQLLQTLVNLR
ncbi:MAG: flagellar hook protein FlgE [Ideonella sp.]|nr:flagellar hook protein FlgE [Ideonella sp.]